MTVRNDPNVSFPAETKPIVTQHLVEKGKIEGGHDVSKEVPNKSTGEKILRATAYIFLAAIILFTAPVSIPFLAAVILIKGLINMAKKTKNVAEKTPLIEKNTIPENKAQQLRFEEIQGLPSKPSDQTEPMLPKSLDQTEPDQIHELPSDQNELELSDQIESVFSDEIEPVSNQFEPEPPEQMSDVTSENAKNEIGTALKKGKWEVEREDQKAFKDNESQKTPFEQLRSEFNRSDIYFGQEKLVETNFNLLENHSKNAKNNIALLVGAQVVGDLNDALVINQQLRDSLNIQEFISFRNLNEFKQEVIVTEDDKSTKFDYYIVYSGFKINDVTDELDEVFVGFHRTVTISNEDLEKNLGSPMESLKVNDRYVSAQNNPQVVYNTLKSE